ncbi:hypothetical protein J2W32_002994 [Variovorax boronicumulans]|uniref:Uncharacterized protein n=1 Tax=Variovorax boronicumulans TaxID=436515 RepID=A0AAW8D0X5_9BURK|nr:hypothetical protein [Variovorax boronicumulans]MDP9894119.1 hypothetical protein [Variovorax boronicumulans]MDQ0053938.1 hypothetical protein [Variovorax boronicumulans]
MPLLVACTTGGSTCSFFNRDNSLLCKATLVGMVVLAPPVEAIDNVLFEKSRIAKREQAWAEEKARHLPIYESMRDRVRAGDRSALRSCMARCEGMGYMVVSKDEALALRVEAATALMKVAGTAPETDDVAPLVIATALLAEQDLELDPGIIRIGLELTRRPDFGTLAESNPYARMNFGFMRALSMIYGRHLALRVMSEPKMRASFDVSCVDTVVANYRMSDLPSAVSANAGSTCNAAREVLDSKNRSLKKE